MRNSNLIYAFPNKQNEAPRRIRSRTSMHADRCVALCCGVFLAGVLLGAFSISFSRGTLREYIAFLTETELRIRTSGTAIGVFTRAFLPKLLVIALLFLASGSIFGAPLCLVLLTLCGASAGICSGCAYHILGVKAFAFNLVVLFPPTLIFAFSAALYAARALRTSNALYSAVFREHSVAKYSAMFTRNCKALFVTAAAVVVSAAVECVLFAAFGTHFF